MAQGSGPRPTDSAAGRPLVARLAPGLLIAAIVVLIVIAVVSFN